ncbi:hypothetical protein [uncultured Methylobacterium sp.]|jgi:hypothetical protein|uniref:hypothetical protein n=1 Tax=uncultured Methylobacterium sp. TaxID=157278 RepID=UPI0026121222|nr:hypothetical protein [uncultured Methylobacterium sp.]
MPEPRHSPTFRTGRTAKVVYGYRIARTRPPRPGNDNRRLRRASIPFVVVMWLGLLAAIATLLWQASHP